MCYNAGMSLLSAQWQGFGWCLLLYTLIFLFVHLVSVAAVGYRTLFKKPPPEKAEPPKPPEKKPETVYYLVERKKKRASKTYSEPKEISFR